MDELAHDLSVALKESSKELQQTVRRHNRKRKGKVRRNSNGMVDEMSLYSVDFPNRSEASGGSDLDAIFSAGSLQTCRQLTSNDDPDQRQSAAVAPTKLNIEGTTDSEDQCGRITVKLSALSFPNNSLLSGGDPESDSVNEINQEKKSTNHARRRRRAKLNASPSIVTGSADAILVSEMERKVKPRPHIRKKEVMDTENINSLSELGRKRHLQKMEAESSGYFPCVGSETGYYDMSSESSLLTSDGEETCDDHAGEADDEQSDFFHEVNGGSTYGIPLLSSDSMSATPTTSTAGSFTGLHHLLQNSHPQFSSLPNKLKRTKCSKYGRPIRTGHRRLKASNKTYTSSSGQSHEYMFAPPTLSYSCPEYKYAKRRRQYQPSTPSIDVPSGDKPFTDAKVSYPVPIPEWNACPDKRPSALSFRNSSTSTSTSSSRRRRRALFLVQSFSTAKKAGST